jgi:hypothetical protein
MEGDNNELNLEEIMREDMEWLHGAQCALGFVKF